MQLDQIDVRRLFTPRRSKVEQQLELDGKPADMHCPACKGQCKHLVKEWRGYLLEGWMCVLCANDAVQKGKTKGDA